MSWLWTTWDVTFRMSGFWLGLITLIGVVLLVGVPVAINTIWSWRYLHARKSTVDFGRLVDTLTIGIVLVNPDDIVVLANRAASDLWAEVGIGKVLPAELARLRASPDGSSSALLTTSEGTRVVARVHSFAVSRGREQLISLDDATQLQEESAFTTALLRQVTHELKTPLSVIRGHASRFAAGGSFDPDETKRAWSVVDDEASRLTALIDQALLMARLETPDPLFERRPVNLRALCEEVVIDLSERAKLQRADLEFEVDDGRYVIDGDRPAMRQMLLNLIDNAMKYGGDGVQVTLALQHDETLNQIRLSVRDSGPGISEMDLPLIFEKGYRGAHLRGSRVGSGLGLALVRSIATWHGGLVSVESESGHGAMVTVLLPDGQARP